MESLPWDVLVEIAGHTSLRGLVNLSSCSRDLRYLLECPSVWATRCKKNSLAFSSFVYLGARGVLKRAHTLQLHHSRDDGQWQPMLEENLAALKFLSLDKFLEDNELTYVFRTVPRERLKQLQIPPLFQRDIFLLNLMSNGKPFSNLTHLNMALYSFSHNHASVITLQCPNLRFLILHLAASNVSDEEEQSFATAVNFSKLKTLHYCGDLRIAKFFRDASALSILRLDGNAGGLREWTRLKAKNVVNLRVIKLYDDLETQQHVFDLLTKWHESLRCVVLPKNFVEQGKLLEFCERYGGRLRLETLYYTYDEKDEDGAKMRRLLFDKCPSLKEILEEKTHFKSFMRQFYRILQ